MVGNDGLQVVAFLADTDGSGDYSSLDGGLLAKGGPLTGWHPMAGGTA